MLHKWLGRAVIVLGVFALLGAIVALAHSQTQDLIMALAIGLFSGVVLLETHLRQVKRDQHARLAQRHL